MFLAENVFNIYRGGCNILKSLGIILKDSQYDIPGIVKKSIAI